MLVAKACLVPCPYDSARLSWLKAGPAKVVNSISPAPLALWFASSSAVAASTVRVPRRPCVSASPPLPRPRLRPRPGPRARGPARSPSRPPPLRRLPGTGSRMMSEELPSTLGLRESVGRVVVLPLDSTCFREVLSKLPMI